MRALRQKSLLLTILRYAKDDEFSMLAHIAGMKTKDRHTIIEKWPTRLKLKPGQPGADNELAIALASHHAHTERYVEWVRTK